MPFDLPILTASAKEEYNTEDLTRNRESKLREKVHCGFLEEVYMVYYPEGIRVSKSV